MSCWRKQRGLPSCHCDPKKERKIMLTPYPSELPFEAVTVVIQKIRNPSSVTNAHAVHAGYHVLGYGLGQALPCNDVVQGVDTTSENVALMLESLSTSAEGMKALPWGVIVSVLVQLLAQWLLKND